MIPLAAEPAKITKCTMELVENDSLGVHFRTLMAAISRVGLSVPPAAGLLKRPAARPSDSSRNQVSIGVGKETGPCFAWGHSGVMVAEA